MFSITKGLIVVRPEALVKTDLTIIIRTIIPEVLGYGVSLFGQIFVYLFVQSAHIRQHRRIRSVELRVITETIYTVIVKEFGYLLTNGRILGHVIQSGSPIGRQTAPGNRGHTRNTYTVFMGGIGKTTGHPALRSGPVAIVGNIRPHTEYFGIELAVRPCIRVTSRSGTYGNPEHQVLVGLFGQCFVNLRVGIAETSFGFHTRDVKVFIFKQVFSRSPLGSILSKTLAIGPCHVLLFQLLCIGRERKSQDSGKQK